VSWAPKSCSLANLNFRIALVRNRVRREMWWSTAGIKTRLGTGSFRPVAIRAAVEATRLLEPLVQRVAWRLGELAGRNVSER
jgi:hypothetical protein